MRDFARFSNNRTALLTVVLVVMLALPAFVGSAVATPSPLPQQATTTTTTANNSTGGPNDQPARHIGGGTYTTLTGEAGAPQGGENTSSNQTTTTSSESGGDGGNGGWLNLDPVGNLKDIISKLFTLPGKMLANLVNGYIFGVPAPGQATEPATWSNPDSAMWDGIVDFTGTTTALATVVLVFSGGSSFLKSDEYARRTAWKKWMFGLLMIVTTWTFVPLTLHLANGIAQSLVPDGSKIFQNWANMGKVGSGLGFTFILGALQPSIVAAGLFALTVERFMIYIGVGLWPLAWALRTTNNSFAQSIGQTAIYLFGVAIVTKLVQALIANFLFSLQWSGLSGETLETLLLIGAGIAFTLIYFPVKMFQHANQAASVSLGVGANSRQVGQYAEKAHERVGQIHERVDDYRAEGGDTPEDTDRHNSHSNSGTSGSGSGNDDNPLSSPLTSMTDYDTSIDDRAIPDDLEEQAARIERTETMSQRLSDD